MPTLVELGRIRIRIYARDHNPPHFHVATPDHSAMISLATLKVISGVLPKRDYQLAVHWAQDNMELLMKEWNRLNG